MKAIRNCAFIGILVAMNQVSYSQEIWTIGPMLHFGIGGEKKNNSFSIEAGTGTFTALGHLSSN